MQQSCRSEGAEKTAQRQDQEKDLGENICIIARAPLPVKQEEQDGGNNTVHRDEHGYAFIVSSESFIEQVVISEQEALSLVIRHVTNDGTMKVVLKPDVTNIVRSISQSTSQVTHHVRKAFTYGSP
jgi:hypothetical protein